MKTKKNRKLNKIKTLSFLVIVVIVILSVYTLARYIYNNIKDSYTTSSTFYFYSNLLKDTSENVEHTYSNWNGIDEYKLYLNLYNYNYPNELEKSTYDIDYNLYCEANPYVDCQILNNLDNVITMPDTIYQGTSKKSVRIKVKVKDGVNISGLDEIRLVVHAKAFKSTDEGTASFERELKATFVLQFNSTNIAYKIEDVANNEYFDFLITNIEKNEKNINLSLNPSLVRFDLGDSNFVKYLNAGSTTTEVVNNISYVKKAGIKIPGNSTTKLRFYKVNKNEDYSYESNTNIGETCIITVSD